MTSSLSWLASNGLDAHAVYEALSLRGAGERAAAPNWPLAGAELPGGWTLVFTRQLEFADSAAHERLSTGGELITCSLDESLMYSSISGWRDGKREWYIIHDGEMGIQHIHIEGQPPPEFFPLYNRLTVYQAEAGGLNITVDHVYEVPIELARQLTGFRHDEAVADIQFERLESKPTQ